jgi:hypothetical protein
MGKSRCKERHEPFFAEISRGHELKIACSICFMTCRKSLRQGRLPSGQQGSQDRMITIMASSLIRTGLRNRPRLIEHIPKERTADQKRKPAALEMRAWIIQEPET